MGMDEWQLHQPNTKTQGKRLTDTLRRRVGHTAIYGNPICGEFCESKRLRYNEIASKAGYLKEIDMADTPKPGIYPGVPFDDYLKWKAVSNTVLVTLRKRSPLHARYFMDRPFPSTPDQVIGHATHCLALERDSFDSRYIVGPKVDGRTKAGKKAWAEFEDTVNGRCVLTGEQHIVSVKTTEAINTQVIHKFIRQGEAEVCLVWIDEQTGLLCKGRLDYAHRSRALLIDLKTTRDASPEGFQRAMAKWSYHQQAAFYCDGWKTLTKDDPCFVFLPLEKTPPYAAAAYQVGDDTLLAGRNLYRAAIETYAECLKTDTWPGYGDKVEMLDIPIYALRDAGVNPYQEEY